MVLAFSDVPVAPFTRLLGNGSYHLGGPVWPDWDSQTVARHCRGGQPVDECPVPPAHPARIEAAQWCGPIHPHFGHMIAEFGMRILPSALNDPSTPLLFSGWPPKRYAGRDRPLPVAPPGFRDMLLYAGVRLHRIIVDTQGLQVDQLSVEPQAEQMGNVGPSSDHLDLLDEHAAKVLGPARADPRPTFFSRAGMFARFGGEAWIERVFEAAGFRTIRPETLPLSEQLALYHGCGTAIFSEGSALHAPQLLGRCFDRVAVFNRRPGKRRMNAMSLAPRAGAITYHAAIRDTAMLVLPDGQPVPELALTLIDPDIFLAALDDIGLPIARHWDPAAFRAAEEADVEAWLAQARQARLWAVPASRAAVQAVLDRHFGGRIRVD